MKGRKNVPGAVSEPVLMSVDVGMLTLLFERSFDEPGIQIRGRFKNY